jgi:hypothetical protein
MSLAADFEESSIRVQLLADVRRVFEAENEDRIFSSELATRLTALAGGDEEAGPWAAYGRDCKPITQRQVARLLSEFLIFPRTVRDEAQRAKGYLLEQFEDAFDRYLAPISLPPPDRSVQTGQTIDINDLSPKQSVTPGALVTDQNASKSLKENKGHGSTDRTPPKREKGTFRHICPQCRGEPDGTEEFCAFGDEAIWLHRRCQQAYAARPLIRSDDDRPRGANQNE